MKKVLLIIVLAVFGLSLALADEALGIRAGVNLTNRSYSGDNDIETSDRLGFHAGMLVQYPVGKYLMLQPELMYTQKGYNWLIEIPLLDDIAYQIRTDYVELPILLKLNLDFGGVAIQPFVAPQVGYAVVAERQINTNIEKIMDELSPFQYGGQLGLDLQINDDLLVGGRYNINLTDIWDDDDANVAYTHNGWVFSIGYLF